MRISDKLLPDFLIVGAAKSGTTSLFFYLAQHPELFLPTTFKEPGYLCFAGRQRPAENPAEPYPDMWQSVVWDLPAYSDLFTGSRPDQMLGEATPEYLYLYRETIDNIRKLYGSRASELKYVAILRDPISRIWSHYWMFRRDGYETLPFDQATAQKTIDERLQRGWHPSYDYRGFGRYAEQISAWQEAFGRESLKVVLLEDLHKNAAETCRDVFKHLGVAQSYVADTSVNYNVSGALRHPWAHDLLFRRQYAIKDLVRWIVPAGILQSVKQKLLTWNTEKVPMPADVRNEFQAYYRADIESLQKLIGRNLDKWLT